MVNGRLKSGHASSLPFSPNDDKFVCSAMRKGGDRSSCRGVCPEGRRGWRGGERCEESSRQRPVAPLLTERDAGATLLGKRYEPR